MKGPLVEMTSKCTISSNHTKQMYLVDEITTHESILGTNVYNLIRAIIVAYQFKKGRPL